MLGIIFPPQTKATDYKSKLLSLIAFNNLKSGLASVGKELDANLDSAWSQHLNPTEIIKLIINYNEGTVVVSFKRREALENRLITTFRAILESTVSNNDNRDYLLTVLRESLRCNNVDKTFKTLIRSAIPIAKGSAGESVESRGDTATDKYPASYSHKKDKEEVIGYVAVF